MDAYESALLAWHLGVNIAIPMHHLLVKGGWPGATNDPNLFKNTYEKLGGKGEIRILNLGEETVLTKESTFHN
jgi:L-ascorbate metabolism protein UlaG (beta-lactamase superfamily)